MALGKRRGPSAGEEGLEAADRLGEVEVLHLGEGVDPCPLTVAQDDRRGDVVVEHPFEGVHDLVVQGGLGVLRQAAHPQPHRIGRVQRGDARLREDVDHAGRQAGVGDNRDAALAGRAIEPTLLVDDRGVAAQVGEVDARRYRQPRDLKVEVIGKCAQDRIDSLHQRRNLPGVRCIDLDQAQAALEVRLEAGVDGAGVEVGDHHLVDPGGAQQIEGGGRALGAAAENEKLHERRPGPSRSS